MLSTDELKIQHDELQIGLLPNQMCIRKGIVLDVGTTDVPKFGFEFFCWRSPAMVDEMDCFIEYSKGRKCLLDIGAFHGLFSFVFNRLNKGATSYCFEPYDVPLSVLCQTVLSNDRSIMIYKNALSDDNGKMTFFTYDEHLQHIRVSEAQSEIVVDKATGDAFCEQFKVAPDTIKCDVEGYEWHVINGLRSTILKYHPVIFLELHMELCSKIEIDMLLIFIFIHYKVIDSETKKEISRNEILKTTNKELRLILI